MKLWLLERTDIEEHSTYAGRAEAWWEGYTNELPRCVVVRASDEAAARALAKDELKELHRNKSVENPDYYTCTELTGDGEMTIIAAGSDW